MIVTINVTKYEISMGCKQNPCYCPVAMAINKVLDQDKYVALVTQLRVHIYEQPRSIKDNFISVINLPEEVHDFIMRFDLGPYNLHKPFSFNLDIPQEYLKV